VLAVILLAGALPLGLGRGPFRGTPGSVTDGPNRRREGEVRDTIGRVIANAYHPSLRQPSLPRYQDDMRTLYEPVANAPVWFAGRRPLPQAQDVIRVLREADTRGLPPGEYDVDLLAQWWAAANGEPGLDARETGLFDAALSLDYMRHLADVHLGRINPKELGIGFDIEPKRLNLPDLVRKAIAEGRVRETVAEAEPRFRQYGWLKEALPYYRKLAFDRALPEVATVRKLSPGDRYDGLPQLAKVLAALGDLPAQESMPAGAPARGFYDGDLVEAVKRFQGRHGLNSDGVLGAATLGRLNVLPEQRVRQIELSLERLRWLPESVGPVIGINIPSFRLWCFDLPALGGKPTLEMKIVVGKALDTQTPVFGERMRYVVFRPYWNVPYSIAVKETLPAIEREPGYLDANDMEIACGAGDDASIVAPTEESLALVSTGECRIRQRPGPGNALGLVAFMFPNDANVYLHGTPASGLFARDRRDLSHGCLRAEDPRELAAWVLRGVPGWDRARVEQALAATGPPQRVDLPRPIPVLIVYTTAVSDVDGRIAFFEDIYGHDQRLESALMARVTSCAWSGLPFPAARRRHPGSW
jgi:murein L,D-transpeptidase YcbB/YkuD